MVPSLEEPASKMPGWTVGLKQSPARKGEEVNQERQTQAPRGGRDAARRFSQKSSSNPGGFQSKGLQDCSGSNIKKELEGKDGRNSEEQRSVKVRPGSSLLLALLTSSFCTP